MNQEDSVTPQKKHNTSIIECEDEDISEMPEKKFKRMMVRSLKNRETNS